MNDQLSEIKARLIRYLDAHDYLYRVEDMSQEKRDELQLAKSEFQKFAAEDLAWCVERIETLERQNHLLSTPFDDVLAELGLTDADLDGDEGDDDAGAG